MQRVQSGGAGKAAEALIFEGLENLDINEISAPLIAITATADLLEERYTGKDFH